MGVIIIAIGFAIGIGCTACWGNGNYSKWLIIAVFIAAMFVPFGAGMLAFGKPWPGY